VFAQGDCLLIYNATDSGMTITQGSGMFMRQEGTINSGNRTLLARSRASILFLSTGECVIGGAIT
jgi:hypothetical protein